MSTYAIKWLKDKLGTRFFPVTHINAVRDDEGTSLASMLEAKQNTLVSGTNIKTVNNNSLVGSGNVSIATGDTNVINTVKVNGTALTPDANKAVNISAVTSFNGSTGAVTYTAPVTSVNGETGAVSIATGDTNVIETVKVNNAALTPDANKAVNITAVTTFNGSSGAVTYTAPVSSVNGQTGAVSISTGDTNVIETIKVNNSALTPDSSKAVNISAVTSFNGSTGAVTYTAPVTSVNGQTGTVTLSIPSEVTETTVSGWGFTKNAGTITGITMNGASKGTSGVVDLGTVITSHQDISGKADKATTLAGYGITNAYTKTECNSGFWAIYGGTNLNPSSSNQVDLNTLTSTGSYYCKKSTSAPYVSNKPTTTDAAFRVWVTTSTDTGYLRQFFQYYNSSAIYERHSVSDTGATWVSWTTITESSQSDERLKNIIGDVEIDLEAIASAPSVLFKWKDERDNRVHGGSIAQYWENGVASWAVSERDGCFSLDYKELALVSSITIAREVLELKKELAEIKEMLAKLNK